MSNKPFKFGFDPAMKKAMSNYAFRFAIDGLWYRTWYDPEKDNVFYDCSDDTEESLGEFLLHLTQLITHHAASSDIKELDLQKFAVKHLKANIKVEKALDKIG